MTYNVFSRTLNPTQSIDYDQRGRRGSRGGGNRRGTRTIGSSDDGWVVKDARMTRRRREGKVRRGERREENGRGGERRGEE